MEIKQKIKELVKKNKILIAYAFFGGLTTLLNIGAYALCFKVFGIENVPSVVISQIVAIIFAYITNKLWVFESKSFDKQTIIHETVTFFCSRAVVGVLEVAVMHLAVDIAGLPAMPSKIMSSVIAIICNYIASRLLVFKESKIMAAKGIGGEGSVK